MSTPAKRWVIRLLFVLAVVVVGIVGARLGHDDIAVVPLVAGTLAACSVWWFGADTAGSVFVTRWNDPQEYRMPQTRGDPATGYLRRLCTDVTAPGRRSSPTAPAALQTAVRRLVQDRLDQRPMRGLPASAPLSPSLRSYLQADPAPRLRAEELDRIVTSIEEL